LATSHNANSKPNSRHAPSHRRKERVPASSSQEHREWLRQIEAGISPDERWTSRGFLAGWVAASARVGKGAEAWDRLNAKWDHASDEGEEVCPTGGEVEDCPKRAVLKFPERLKLFLEQNGYPLT
jgi:hypothetical protein